MTEAEQNRRESTGQQAEPVYEDNPIVEEVYQADPPTEQAHEDDPLAEHVHEDDLLAEHVHEDDPLAEHVHEVGPQAEQADAGAATPADDVSAGQETRTRLVAADEAERFVARWQEIQAGFVDEPRRAVQDADALVADLMQRLAQMLASERRQLESHWSTGVDVSTEDLRQGLRRYRSLFERLIAALASGRGLPLDDDAPRRGLRPPPGAPPIPQARPAPL